MSVRDSRSEPDAPDPAESAAERRDMHSRLLRLEKRAREQGQVMLAHLIGVAALEAQRIEAAAYQGNGEARSKVVKGF